MIFSILRIMPVTENDVSHEKIQPSFYDKKLGLLLKLLEFMARIEYMARIYPQM
jgi:hypothetical protein